VKFCACSTWHRSGLPTGSRRGLPNGVANVDRRGRGRRSSPRAYHGSVVARLTPSDCHPRRRHGPWWWELHRHPSPTPSTCIRRRGESASDPCRSTRPAAPRHAFHWPPDIATVGLNSGIPRIHPTRISNSANQGDDRFDQPRPEHGLLQPACRLTITRAERVGTGVGIPFGGGRRRDARGPPPSVEPGSSAWRARSVTRILRTDGSFGGPFQNRSCGGITSYLVQWAVPRSTVNAPERRRH
jgi:hypothetical protein